MKFGTASGVVFQVDQVHQLIRRVSLKGHQINQKWIEFAWIHPINPKLPVQLPIEGSVDIELGSRVRIMFRHMINGHAHAIDTTRIIMALPDDDVRYVKKTINRQPLQKGPYHNAHLYRPDGYESSCDANRKEVGNQRDDDLQGLLETGTQEEREANVRWDGGDSDPPIAS